MFILDSLMISGIRWTLETVAAAADAERNDDTALREQLLEAEMRRELGELSDADFKDVETDLLARIREIRERRDGGAGPLALSAAEPLAADGGSRFNVEATLAGDYHAPAVPDAPSTGGDARATSPAAAGGGVPASPRRRAAPVSRPRSRASRPASRKRRA